MESIYKLGAIVRLVDMFTGPAMRAGRSAQGLARKINLVDKSLKALKVGMVALGVAAALTLPLAAGAEAAGNFETGITRLGLISQATAGEVAQLRGEALKLGVLTEWSPKEAVAGMTALASAGYLVQEQLAGIGTILDFATASQGFLDLTASVKITDSVLKTYGMQMKDASMVTDKLSRLTTLATIEYRELATAIPVVSAAGAAANQSLSDTLALLGAIRPAAQSTQDAAQIFNSFAQAIKAPLRRTRKYIQSKFGIDVNQLFRAEGGTGELLSMIQIVENLQKATRGLNQAQKAEFLQKSLNATGSKAYNAVLQMTHSTMEDGRMVTLHGVDAVRAMSDKLDNATGTTKTFAAEMMATWQGVKKMIAGTLETFAIVLGMGPLQVIKALISSITGLLNPILAWMQRHERLTTIIGASVTVVVALGLALGLLAVALGLGGLLTAKIGVALGALSLTSIKGKFLALAGGVRAFSLALLASPITWIVLAIIGLAVAVVWAYNRFQGFRNIVDALGARFRSLAAGIRAGLVVVFKDVAKRLEPLTKQFIRLGEWLGITGTKGENTTKVFGDWIDVGIAIGKVLAGLILVALGLIIAKMIVLTAVMLANPITWIVLGIMAAIAGVVALVYYWGDITEWLMGIWDKVAGFFEDLWGLIKAAFTVGVLWLKQLFLDYHPVGLVIKHWDTIAAYFTDLWGLIKAAFMVGVLWLKQLFLDYHPVGLVIKHWDTIAAYFTDLWGRIKAAFMAGVLWLKQLFLDYHPAGLVIKHWDTIVSYFSGLWDRVLTAVTQGWQKIKDYLTGLNLADAGRALWETFVSGITSIIDKPMEVVKEGLAKLRNLLPFSDAKEGPLSNLTASGRAIPKTLALGMEAAAPVLRSTADTVFSGLSPGLDGAGQMGQRFEVDPASLGLDWPVQEQEGKPHKVDLAAIKERLAGQGGQQVDLEAAQRQAEKAARPITINKLIIKLDAQDLSTLQDLVDLIQGLGVEGVPA